MSALSIQLVGPVNSHSRRLLTDAEFRLGRHSVAELTSHKFFANVRWTNLHDGGFLCYTCTVLMLIFGH